MVSIERIEEEGFFEIRIEGEIDASSSVLLDEALGFAIKNYENILIDLKNLEYISSAGLGVFMSYVGEVEEKRMRMILYGLSENVKHIFEILGIDQLLSIKESKQQALETLNETSA